MSTPLFSVVIPAYNQAQFLGETIQSVLKQSYSNFELIIVNDASPDQTTEIVNSFKDQRIKYIIHAINKGLPGARNTGIRAASGKFLALLDADDLFHPDKLMIHAEYLMNHPHVHVTYNNRFDLNHSATTIRDLYRPPKTVYLTDLLQGFLFSPSDMVIRLDGVHESELFDERLTSGGEDLDFPLRLALKGYSFVNVDKALNYRRYHAGRKRKNLLARITEYTFALDNILSDPRCPKDLITLRQTAIRNFYLEVTYRAFYQDDVEIGCEVLRRISDIDPAWGDLHSKSELLENFLHRSLANENDEHGQMLRKIFAQFPAGLIPFDKEIDQAIGFGYLIKGARAIMWDRSVEGGNYLRTAKRLGVSVNKKYIDYMTKKLFDYENEFGYRASNQMLDKIVLAFKEIGDFGSVERLKGAYEFNRVFQEYHEGYYYPALAGSIRLAVTNPRNLMNRGFVSIFLKSLVRVMKSKAYHFG